jgi:hypothetical protein
LENPEFGIPGNSTGFFEFRILTFPEFPPPGIQLNSEFQEFNFEFREFSRIGVLRKFTIWVMRQWQGLYIPVVPVELLNSKESFSTEGNNT